uniref:Cytochrome c oxidase subunit 2 n=1 Tax=Tetrodontophora bielanensis TaxID=48717 RepID=Q9B515_TETBI|nr:cytochrome c oxidase subunit II [Tetrodontophora bielanensis]AAK30942.2 cytochrome oxidase subunit 2 [Tetrodontophora bielanensis]
MPSWLSAGFQNAYSPLMEQLIFFHDHTMTMIILVISIVSYSLISMFIMVTSNKFMTESQQLELFWTISPSLILVLIGLPSIKLLYMLDEVYNPNITLKTVGHQWYWSYEYSDFNNIEFDSYMINSNPKNNNFRLLDVDNKIMVPMNSQIRNLITAADVLHSWTIPSLGVKADAVPGRLNQINFICNSPGLYFGQCSEICGTNHSFMPIVMEVISPKFFIKWIKSNIA